MKNEKIAKVGDKVRIVNPVCTEAKYGYGYGDVFEVFRVYTNGCDVITKTPEPCFVYHFEYELVDGSVVEIDWQVGQEVWCAIYGKCVIEAIFQKRKELEVRISDEIYLYDLKGCPFGSKVRTLFFSEPVVKIEGEEYPPKKPFTPTLKEDDEVVVKTNCVEDGLYTVKEETEHHISFKERALIIHKSNIEGIYKLGEEVKL